ncbi:Thioesterase/thiol ester dehydrase-isomerase [Xylariaceae sp. FL0662B]|nr:Thioesterase/thiol ester dehydrase-isomerase [Xylariaceae sp. FL0662B]
MANATTLESTIATIPHPASGNDAFINKIPFTPEEGVRSVFGGAIASQAITAASATVTHDFNVYSSQSTCLSPSNTQDTLIYKVERVADGRAYATRTVRAEQRGKCVYIAIIAFQRHSISPGPVLTYQVQMPAMDGLKPEDVDDNEFLRHMGDGSPDIAKIHAGEPFEWRPASIEQGNDEPTKYRARGFFRSRTLLPYDRATNLAALAYVSDKWLAGTALSANPKEIGERMKNLATVASLTHNLSFHDPDVRVDEWLVAERDTSWGANGRSHHTSEDLALEERPPCFGLYPGSSCLVKARKALACYNIK